MSQQLGRFTGLFEATIYDVKDEQGLRMVRAHIPALGSPGNPFITVWATPNNGVHQKDFPRKGRGTFIQFRYPADTTQFPVWSGCFDSFPNGQSELAGIAQGPPQDPAPMGRGIFKATTISWEDIGGPVSAPVPEPAEVAKTDKWCNHTWNDGGIVEQRNTTPGAQRYSLSVGGQYWELNAKGAEVSRVRGRFDINRGPERHYVGGMLTEVVAGLARRDYRQDYAVSVGGAVYALASALRARVGTVTFTVDAKDGSDDVQGLRVESLGSLELLSVSDLALQGGTIRAMAKDMIDVTSHGELFLGSVSGTTLTAPSVTVRLGSPLRPAGGALIVRNFAEPDQAALSPLLMSPAAFGLFSAMLTSLAGEFAIVGAKPAVSAFAGTIGLQTRPALSARFT